MRHPLTRWTAPLGLGLGLLLVPHPGQSRTSQTALRHRSRTPHTALLQREDCYGFELDRLHVQHQGPNVITVTVLYRYAPTLKPADYMDVNDLRKLVLDTIRTYPRPNDYWEIYNARIADRLMARYPTQIDALRVKLEIAPDNGAEPFARTSLVVRTHPGRPPLIP